MVRLGPWRRAAEAVFDQKPVWIDPGARDLGVRMIRLPLRDRVLLRPIEFKHSDSVRCWHRASQGRGSGGGSWGRRLRRKIPWMMPDDSAPGQSVNPGQTFWVEDGPETGKIAPMSVKVGDVVDFGFRDVFPVKHEGEELLMVWQKNIYGLSGGDILEAQSAAID